MDQAAEVTLEVFRAIEERDRERLFALYHEQVEFDWPRSLPYGGVVRGKARARQQLESAPEETWLGAWGPLQPTEAERAMDPEVIHSDGSRVVIAYTQRALSSAGERFEEPVIGIYRIRDGLFASAQMFHYDTAAIAAFLERSQAQPKGAG